MVLHANKGNHWPRQRGDNSLFFFFSRFYNLLFFWPVVFGHRLCCIPSCFITTRSSSRHRWLWNCSPMLNSRALEAHQWMVNTNMGAYCIDCNSLLSPWGQRGIVLNTGRETVHIQEALKKKKKCKQQWIIDNENALNRWLWPFC